MHPIWWFLIIVALIILIAPWNILRDDALRSRAQQIGMERRLRRFEQMQRVRHQAAVMQRTREINALAHQTCQAMVRAAVEAQQKELSSSDE